MPEKILLHHRIKEQVTDQIRMGALSGKLPSMDVLGQEFNASRITMRNILKELETEGYVSVRQGSGTFVTYSRELQIENHFKSLSEPNPFLAAITRYTAFLGNREIPRDVRTKMIEVMDAQIELVERSRASQ